MKWRIVVVDAGAADVLLDQPGMALVVLDHDDGDGLMRRSRGGSPCARQSAAAERGGRSRPGQARSSQLISAAEPVGQRPHVGEADALARLVLRAGAAEQLEDALVVLRVDAAAVVLRPRRRRAPPLARPRTTIRPGPAGLEVLDRVLDEVAKDLLDRDAGR